jgi:hypothetical protein
VRANWATETFQGNFAQLFEAKPLANAELGNRVCHQDLFRLRVSTKAGSELDCRSKEIVMLLDRLTCCGADSNLERALGIRLRMLV